MRGGGAAATLSGVNSSTGRTPRMSRITANGIELNYDRTGSGEPLVLVHGGWSDRNNWQLVVPGLAASFSVVAYDRRGHGLSAA